MNNLLLLYKYAEEHDIDVDLFCMEKVESMSAKLSDGSCAIAIDPIKLKGEYDEVSKLAHELGHCETGSFYCKYAPLDERGRCEERAKRWAIKKLIPLEELEEAIKKCCVNTYELSEYFCVPEKMICDAIKYYTQACGLRPKIFFTEGCQNIDY